MSKLSGKIAVVTGGTGALGRIVTDFFLQEGATVVVTHSGKVQSIRYIEEIQQKHENFFGYAVDVTSELSVTTFYKDILKRYGRVDILCNLVGGVGKKRAVEDMPSDEWNAMISLNLHSCFFMMRDAVRMMKQHRFGRIINIAAMPAVVPEALRGGYGVAKAGVVALTKTVAEEVKEFGDLTVNAIAPSIIRTEENLKWGTREEVDRWVTPEQIAAMMVHLCSSEGAPINGQILQMYGKV
ncbi:MAG: SDR family NAD(P)-dependent oxidoreductase [Bacteroidota bacterium]